MQSYLRSQAILHAPVLQCTLAALEGKNAKAYPFIASELGLSVDLDIDL